MKKVACFLIIILLPVAVFGFGLLQQMGSVPSGATPFQSCSETGNSSNNQIYNWFYMQYRFQAGSTTTLTSIDLDIIKNGTNATEVRVEIYSDDAADPDSFLDQSNDVEYNDLPSAEGTWQNFDGLSVSLTNGDYYWIEVRIVAYTSAGNELRWYKDSGCGTGTVYGSDNAASAGSSLSTDAIPRFKLYD